MCWSAKVSLESFQIGLLAIGFAAVSGVPFPALLFYATIVSMQFVEFVVWRWGLVNSDVNFGASLAAFGLLCLQPAAAILTLQQPKLVLGAYVGAIVLHCLLQKESCPRPLRDRFRMQPGPDGHLAWKWLERDSFTDVGLGIYFAFLLIPVLISQDVEFSFILLATLAASLYSHGSNRTWGSMWCWIVNWMVVATGLRYFLQKHGPHLQRSVLGLRKL
jgi:hypothetical protein